MTNPSEKLPQQHQQPPQQQQGYQYNQQQQQQPNTKYPSPPNQHHQQHQHQQQGYQYNQQYIYPNQQPPPYPHQQQQYQQYQQQQQQHPPPPPNRSPPYSHQQQQQYQHQQQPQPQQTNPNFQQQHPIYQPQQQSNPNSSPPSTHHQQDNNNGGGQVTHHHHHYHHFGSPNSSSNFIPSPPLSPTKTGVGSNGGESLMGPIPGAHADGRRDDSKAINDFLNRNPKNKIIIPPGTYLVTQPIYITKSNVHIQGSNNVKIIGNFPGWINNPISQGFINDKEYLFVLKGDNIVIDTVNMYNFCQLSKSSSAIYSQGNGFILKNCIIDNFNQGLVFGVLKTTDQPPPNSVFSNIKITQNQITNVIGTPGGSICYGDGIGFFGCRDVVISNNFISAKPGFTPRNGVNSGPEGYVTSTNILFHNNTLRGDWDYPLTTETGENCTLSNNDIEGCSIASIIERGKFVKILNNKIHITGRQNNGEACAIQFYGVDVGEISNNSIMGTAPYGIIIKPSHETGGGNDTVIENNTIDGDFMNCLFFCNTNTARVKGNVILGKSRDQSSVGLQLWYANNLEVHENNFDLPQGTACICSGTNDVQVKSNTMMSSRAGFYICRGSKTVSIQDNDLIGVSQTKFDQSNDNIDVTHCKNHGFDYHPPCDKDNNNNNTHPSPHVHSLIKNY
eukprot:gene6792-8427_t